MVFFIFQVSGVNYVQHKKTYNVLANFNDIGGLRVHAPVTISGVKVGEVARIKLDPVALSHGVRGLSKKVTSSDPKDFTN